MFRTSLSCLFFVLISFSAHSFETQKLNTYLDTLAGNDKMMVSVAVTADGEPVYQHATGFANKAEDISATPDTGYRIGSITKVFTAVMIYQLIEEGKLSLDTPLSKYYPTVKLADEITIAMLLGHRSGLQNYTAVPGFANTVTEPKTKAQMVEQLSSLDSDFPPGEQTAYSNSGYLLLGFIVEDITRDTYATALKSRITDKLSLHHTVYSEDIESKAFAHSYAITRTGWTEVPFWSLSLAQGAGAITSTSTDVARFLSGLFAGKLISASSLAQMKSVDGKLGYGLARFPYFDKYIYGHDGSIGGFKSFAAYAEEDKVAVTVLANGVNYSFNDVVIAALNSYYGKEYTIPDFSAKPVSLPASALKKFEGVFASEQLPLKITVRAKDGQLTAQATNQQALTLTAFSESEFRFEPAGIVMHFATDSGNIDPSHFVLYQGGGQFSFSRE